MHKYAQFKAMMHRKLLSLMEAEGWTQSALAKELGISQGYLSRFLKGHNRPRKALRDKIDALTSGLGDRSVEDFVVRVRQASAASEEFRTLVEAALTLVETRNKKA